MTVVDEMLRRALATGVALVLALAGGVLAAPAASAAAATACDGLAPGSYLPGPGTTGVKAGSTLTTSNGDLVISAPGSYENLDVYGYVDVRAANVTIRNSRVRGGAAATVSRGLINATHAAVSNLRVEGVELVPTNPSPYLSGILGHDYTAKCVNVYRTVDGFGVYKTQNPGGPTNVTITQSFVHELAYFSPVSGPSGNHTHNDGIQIQGGSGTVVTYNLLHGNFSTVAGTQNYPHPQTLSNIMLNDNVGKTTNLVVTDNRINGGEISVNGGGLCDYTGADNLGRFWRNTFDGTAFYPGHEIGLFDAVTTVDVGAGTANQNVNLATGAPVSIKRLHDC